MQINRIGMRVSVVCLTFLIGFLNANLFVSRDAVFIPNEIERNIVLRPAGEVNQARVKQSTTEPPCKKYFDYSKYNNLLLEELRINKSLLAKKESSENQNLSRQKLEKLKAEIKSLENRRIEIEFEKTLKKLRERLEDAQEREQNSVHNLLYIENCSEY